MFQEFQEKRGKFVSKAKKNTFFGYSEEHKGYQFVYTGTNKPRREVLGNAGSEAFITRESDRRWISLKDPS